MAKASSKGSGSDNSQGAGLKESGKFFTECQEELKRVSRPTKQETIQATIVTVVIVAFVAAMLCIFDIAFRQLMSVVLS